MVPAGTSRRRPRARQHAHDRSGPLRVTSEDAQPPNDRRYATTAAASSGVNRKDGIGGPGELPLGRLPVTNNVIASASLQPGRPASAGARDAHGR